MRAAIYARISLDKEGEGQGVERQLEDCRKLVADRGWTLVEEYVDNDVSAFSGRKRPEFERMLSADVNTIVVWRTDRLARRGKDLQRFLDTGMQLTSCTEPEFTGSTGLLMLRILAGFAEHESGVKSERVARKMRQKAERGDPHAGGRRCYGYTADGRQLVPEEASLIQEAAKRVLAGETVTAIMRSWAEAGITLPGGGTPTNFRRLLRSPRLIGMRELAGELVEGTFPAILDRSTWDRLRAIIEIKPRFTGRKYLLTGLIYCGRCGTALTGSPQGYRCTKMPTGGCGGITIGSARADAYVVQEVLSAIPERQVEQRADDDVELLLEALRQAEADVSQLAKDHYVDKRISRPAYLAANDELESRCQLLRQQVAEHEAGVPLDGIAESWEHQTLSWKQAVLRVALERIVVHPAKSTRAPVSERVELIERAHRAGPAASGQ